ncbi:MAG: diguanylate cyclase [Syntrophales bacterium]|nr:diguanylate cyclase [Syntrophales bacterium]
MIFSQVFDILDTGIVILDRDLKVFRWNNWMERHSGIAADRIIGQSLFDFFPDLDNPRFFRSCRCVVGLGNLYFFSQKLHRYLFPFKPVSTLDKRFPFMQQSCNMGPIRDENGEITYICITVQDVTDIAVYEQRLIEMNMKDGLTGTYNRRFLNIRLREEINRALRYGNPLSLIMFDLDHFKAVNDIHGHPFGDHILQAVTVLIGTLIRNSDILARYGGEEFCCILPETNLDQARVIAERCRRTVEESMFRFQGIDARITISLGITQMVDGMDTPEKLIDRADQALYTAKRGGRNRVAPSGTLEEKQDTDDKMQV